jgi:hypothetical protein
MEASMAEPEFTDSARGALLWVLWHHQGGSSPTGQAVRFALGMGQFDRLTADQMAQAKAWAPGIPGLAHTDPAGVATSGELKRYALNPDNGMMYESERGPWVRYVDAAGVAPSAEAVERDACDPSLLGKKIGYYPDGKPFGYITEQERADALAAYGVAIPRRPYGWARTSGPGSQGAPLFVQGDRDPNSGGFWGDATYLALYADGVIGLDRPPQEKTR